jgi:hypothetical protein
MEIEPPSTATIISQDSDHDYCAPTLHLRKFSTYSVDDVSYE